MTTQNYRNEAQRIRLESRAKLAEIRRKRGNRRRAMTQTLSIEAQDDAALTEPVNMADLEEVAVDTETAPIDAARTATSVEETDATISASNSEAVAPDDPLEAYAAQNTGFDAAETGPIDGDAAVNVMPEDAQPSAQVADTTDLMQLPGAAEGLIWMLGQCGISSLEDLSKADPQILTTQLGVVGKIVDVKVWISFAAENAAATSS